MSEKFSYQSDDYDRNAQRHVVPLYVKDNLGNYEFSSTATLAKYNGHHYFLFAAHALSEGVSIDQVYTFMTDGSFYQLTKNAIGYKVFEKEDIAIVDSFNVAFEGKNYFNLNLSGLSGFNKNHFAWIGFPASKSKSKKVHNTKSKESLAQQYVEAGDDGSYFKNAKYFSICSRLISNNNAEITGKYVRQNTSLKYAGAVSTAPHPAGMSGGAMYFFSKNQKLKESIDDTFRFAGIGIEYRKDNTIIGVPKVKIIELLKHFNNENPLILELFEKPL
ncbi:hypothetical protein [Pseudomonas syringae]|uniref:hypothetical protein n=1 Tax=Pseudomonas syringae TaxID=317 RepID=UPI00061AE22B|nr:hypothetical protein [Pseudomonas syringae]MBS7418655.1 hypothetical protein [Pseudomonas syringae]